MAIGSGFLSKISNSSGFLRNGAADRGGYLSGIYDRFQKSQTQDSDDDNRKIAVPEQSSSEGLAPASEGSGQPQETAEDRIQDRYDQLQEDGVLIGNSMSDKSYDEVNAAITRKQWDDFEQDDMPYILEYADSITSGKYTDRAIQQARDGINKGFESANKTQQMRDSGMGVNLTEAQRADREKDMGRKKTAALVDAENAARLAATDRENAALSGSAIASTWEKDKK